MSLFFALLLSVTPLWAAPEACSTVDLTTTAGAEMASIPRWNQGNTHLCYAYSAASLVDYYRFQKGDRDVSHITSPLLLSLKTIENYQNAGSSFTGGKVEHAFATAKNYGSCGTLRVTDHLGSSNIDFLLKTLSQTYKESRLYPEKKAVLAETLRQFLHFSKVKVEELPDISEIEKNLSLSENQFITATLMKYCGDLKKLDYLPAPKLLFQPDAPASEIVQQLQTVLSSRTPVGINYCANVVTDPSHQGKMGNHQWLCQKNKNHSAIVVGRKWLDGKCQFLVRDSGCDGYKDLPERCHQGQYWLESQQLTMNLHGIFWLE